MAVRSSMAALITRVRLLINDPVGASAIFDDQTIQDVLDEGRTDIKNGETRAKPTFAGATIQYLDYYTVLTDWEDDVVFKQYLTTVVTPSVAEPIAGHWIFATSTFPPVLVTGKTYDIYRAAADLLERWAARLFLSYDVIVGGQTFRRSQSFEMLQALADKYRLKQRPVSSSLDRLDLYQSGSIGEDPLGPTNIDYFAPG